MTLATQRGPERQAPVIVTDEAKQRQVLHLYLSACEMIKNGSEVMTQAQAIQIRDWAEPRLTPENRQKHVSCHAPIQFHENDFAGLNV